MRILFKGFFKEKTELGKYLTPKQKVGIKEYLVKEDGTDCVHCEKELDLSTCVISHLDNNPKHNDPWNHALSHQQCNIDVIENFDYQLKAQERIRQNHSKIYAPRIEIKNETVSTEVDINVSNREIAKQYLTERTIDNKTTDYKDALDSITYLCQKMTGHGSQKCVRDYLSSFCSSIAPFMIVKDENKNKVIQRRSGN